MCRASAVLVTGVVAVFLIFSPLSKAFAQNGTVYLPLINAGQEANEHGQDQLEPLSVASIVLGEDPPADAPEKPLADAQILSDERTPPEPGAEAPLPESTDMKDNSIEDEVLVEPVAADGWTTIMSQGFEGVFPPDSRWRLLDANGSSYGENYWDDDDYKPHYGRWSAWAANGGANALDPQYYYYRNNMRSWMIYGPFDLRSATDAELLFYYWNRSELNYDYFGWYASVDGTNFSGYRLSGDSGGWRYRNFDLTSVPYLGDLRGRSSVWIAFVFTSDSSVVNDGPFVDDITLRKLVNTATCPGQYRAEYFNNRTLSGSPTVTRCENWPIKYNWGGGSPVTGIGSDNFSVRWTGTAYISAGTYTFLAAADDGIRVWLDNNLIIDAWRDQAPTAYRTNRTVTSGNHTVKVEYYEYGGGAVAQFAWAPAVSGSIPGITYSTSNGFKVFKIDLWSSNLSFETVMAKDATSGNTTKVEYVKEMVSRAPYVNRNPVLAFNADYFGVVSGVVTHGAQGLTVKNGVRLPNAGTDNGDEWRRSSLSVSKSKSVRIGVQTDCKGPPATACSTWTPNPDAYYNTVGGGPLFVRDGIRIGGEESTTPCEIEKYGDYYCTGSFKWTAAGISRDGRYLIVVASAEAKTMDQAAAVLLAKGAWRALKFDSGTSTQVWYKPEGTVVPAGSRVTNALLVFSSQ